MEFHLLIDYLERNPNRVSEIKANYLNLLRELTDAPDISDDTFVSAVNNIHKTGFTIIGVAEESIVCTGTIIIEPKIIHGGKSAGHIEDIVVLPSWRGKGLGTALIDHLKMIIQSQKNYK